MRRPRTLLLVDIASSAAYMLACEDPPSSPSPYLDVQAAEPAECVAQLLARYYPPNERGVPWCSSGMGSAAADYGRTEVGRQTALKPTSFRRG